MKGKTGKTPDYIAALAEIRAITQGQNAACRPMTWREAVSVWEETHGADERTRAAFMVHIGIATTEECNLLDSRGDGSEDH